MARPRGDSRTGRYNRRRDNRERSRYGRNIASKNRKVDSLQSGNMKKKKKNKQQEIKKLSKNVLASEYSKGKKHTHAAKKLKEAHQFGKAETSGSKVRKTKSKTNFTHIKKHKPQTTEASAPSIAFSRLRYDSTEYSSSALSAMQSPKNLCHVEVCAAPKSCAKVRELKAKIKELLIKRKALEVKIPYKEDSYLRSHIQSINILPAAIEEKKSGGTGIPKYQIHVYQLNNANYITGDWEEEETVTAKHWILPNAEFEGIWETLIFDSPVKEDILNYAMTMLMYGDKDINRNIICCNRVVLLHGPPGTGKTSLCRAMAQKLCIRLSHKYRHGQLVEINSQGLFSKYYSESGKLVGKMFDKIQEFIDKKESLVCILIDEVESLANNRKNMMHGNEPSDSMRVVNALLTRLDEVRRYPNVIVFTTTNVTRAIEAAFLDRADIKKYIGVPNAEAIYSIYRSGLHEIMRAGVITPQLKLLEWSQMEGRKGTSSDPAIKHSLKLKQLSMASVGLSGRSLRKVPMLFHAEYLPAQQMELNNAFWEAIQTSVKKQFKEMDRLRRDPEL